MRDSEELELSEDSVTRISANRQRDQSDHDRPRNASWITMGTAAALGLLLTYQGIHLGFFHGVNEIDDGVYYGEGVMLAHGLLPYRSYLDLQPPGIALLMAPFGLLGRMTSNRMSFELARVFVVIVGVANLGLLGRLIRRRHWVAVLAGLVALGFYIDSLTAEHTILLEPFLVFGTLVGFLIVFGDTEIATSSASRWLVAGAVLGLTTSIKLWEVLPVMVLLVFAAMRSRRCLIHFAVGTVAGFGIICAPFILLAPAKFVQEVIIDQATRSHFGQVGLGFRLWNLLGAPGPGHFTLTSALFVPIALWSIFALVVFSSIIFERRANSNRMVTNLDACAMACLAVVGASFLLATGYYTHYGGFLSLFLAIVLSATAARLVPFAEPFMKIAMAMAMLGFFVIAARGVVGNKNEPPITAALDRVFPPTVCVLSTNYAPLILANRYNLYTPQCPRVLDIYGTELADGHGIAHSATDAHVAKLQADWLGWLKRVDGIILPSTAATSRSLGVNVRTYLRSHFSLVAISEGLFIYRRK